MMTMPPLPACLKRKKVRRRKQKADVIASERIPVPPCIPVPVYWQECDQYFVVLYPPDVPNSYPTGHRLVWVHMLRLPKDKGHVKIRTSCGAVARISIPAFEKARKERDPTVPRNTLGMIRNGTNETIYDDEPVAPPVKEITMEEFTTKPKKETPPTTLAVKTLTKDLEGQDKRDKFYEVARENDIDPTRWDKLNVGQVSMNLTNVLRGRYYKNQVIMVNGVAVK